MSYVFNMVGGGSSGIAYICVTYPEGSICTATQGSVILTAENTNGSYVFCVPSIGNWIVSSTNGAMTASDTASINATGSFSIIKLNYRIPTDIYQPVEYLKSAGRQYLILPTSANISLVRSGSLDFRLDSQSTGTYGDLFMGGTPSSTDAGPTGAFFWALSGTRLVVYQANRSVSLPSMTPGNRYFLTFSIAYGQQTYSLNNQVTNTTINALPANIRYWLFGAHYNNGTKGEKCSQISVYSFVLRNDSNTIIADLIPCYRRSDNVPGMWDVVSKTFLTNSGSGQFTVGPNVNNVN